MEKKELTLRDVYDVIGQRLVSVVGMNENYVPTSVSLRFSGGRTLVLSVGEPEGVPYLKVEEEEK